MGAQLLSCHAVHGEPFWAPLYIARHAQPLSLRYVAPGLIPCCLAAHR